MFTGIVEEVGTIRHIESRAGYQRTTIAAQQVLNGVKDRRQHCHRRCMSYRRTF